MKAPKTSSSSPSGVRHGDVGRRPCAHAGAFPALQVVRNPGAPDYVHRQTRISSYATETGMHSANCAAFLVIPLVQCLVWLLMRPLLHNDMCHSALVADYGSGMVLAGFVGECSIRAVFLDTPGVLGILVGMVQKDSHAESLWPRLSSKWHVHGWFCELRCISRRVPLFVRRHHGWFLDCWETFISVFTALLAATEDTCFTSVLVACGEFPTSLREGGLLWLLRCVSTVDSRPRVSLRVRGFSRVSRANAWFDVELDTCTASVSRDFWKFLQIFYVWQLDSRGCFSSCSVAVAEWRSHHS